MEHFISVTTIKLNTLVTVFFQELDNLVIFNIQDIFVKIEDLTAVTTKASIFWDATPPTLVNRYRRNVSEEPPVSVFRTDPEGGGK
jgi:hypothetical protein